MPINFQGHIPFLFLFVFEKPLQGANQETLFVVVEALLYLLVGMYTHFAAAVLGKVFKRYLKVHRVWVRKTRAYMYMLACRKVGYTWIHHRRTTD